MTETFTTVAKFQYSSEAQIIKGRLEADGIQVFLADNLTIDTDPLVSNAIGGVKLKVLSEDTLKAKHILNCIAKYSMDDNGKPITCPNCHKEEVELFSTITNLKSLFAFIVALIANLLINALPIYTKHKYRCNNCKTEFDIPKQ